jgi:phosphomevalonate kinase
VLAPGKAFLFGEYAVLDGAPALVMAVARYARARRCEGLLSPFAGLVNDAAAAELPGERARVAFEVDSSELESDGRKLGLGSSAAACIAGAALLFHQSGESLASEVVRRRIFRVARAAQDRLQGEPGSGADVAACLDGGLICYENVAGGRWHPVRLPVQIRLLFVETGVPASTSAFLSRVRDLRSSQPSVYHRHVQILGDLASTLGRETSERPVSEVCLLVHSYLAHLEALGRDAGIPIVSDPHRRIAEIARAHGCAAKPSGAGGGDLAVVFCPDPASAVQVRERLAAAGFAPLDLRPDLTGVRLEPESVDP